MNEFTFIVKTPINKFIQSNYKPFEGGKIYIYHIYEKFDGKISYDEFCYYLQQLGFKTKNGVVYGLRSYIPDDVVDGKFNDLYENICRWGDDSVDPYALKVKINKIVSILNEFEIKLRPKN